MVLSNKKLQATATCKNMYISQNIIKRKEGKEQTNKVWFYLNKIVGKITQTNLQGQKHQSQDCLKSAMLTG